MIVRADARLGIILVALVWVGTGCVVIEREGSMGDGPQETKVSGGNVDSILDVRAELTVLEGVARMSYTVRTRVDERVCLFDALPRPDQGGWRHDPALAWVTFEEPETLVLKRVVPDLPSDIDVEMAIVPWCHVVEPGHDHAGRVVVNLPAKETSPYYPEGPTAVFRPASALKVRLVLGYSVLGPNGEAHPVPGLVGIHRFAGPGGQYGEVAVEIPWQRPVSVLRRSDMFEPL